MVSAVSSPVLTVDPDFQKQLFPLSAIEFAHLEHSIIKDGCREKLVVWNGVLVDGHNRYDICTRNGIPFEVREMDFANRRKPKTGLTSTRREDETYRPTSSPSSADVSTTGGKRQNRKLVRKAEANLNLMVAWKTQPKR